MSGEDHDDEGEQYEPPLPPEDRLWRHPSELGSGVASAPRLEVVTRPQAGRVVLVGLLGLLAGVLGTLGILAAIGTFDPPDGPTAVERYATPLDAGNKANTLETASGVLPSLLRIEAWSARGVRNGTALVVRDDGYLLVTSDVVDDADTLTIWFDDGTSEPATLVGRDRVNDLAVVKIDRTGLPAAVLREGHTTDHLAFGDRTIVIDAAPTSGPTPALVEGFVSQPSRAVAGDGTEMYGMIEVSTRPQTAGSGTGRVLIDDEGVVVGLVTSRGQPGPATSGDDGLVLQFVVPIDHAKRAFDQLITQGHVTTPVLGVRGVTEITGSEADAMGITGGLRTDVVERSAAEAGMRRHDVIVRFEGRPVTDLNDLRVQLRRHSPGDTVAITYLRHGEEQVALVVLEEERELP